MIDWQAMKRWLKGGDETRQIAMGSERSFGFVFATAFSIFALWPLTRSGSPRVWALCIAVAFATLALVWPRVLRPLNLVWFRFGLLIGAITTPLVMALLYITAFFPTGLALRMMGKDVLALRREPDRDTYWGSRTDGASTQSTMQRQF